MAPLTQYRNNRRTAAKWKYRFSRNSRYNTLLENLESRVLLSVVTALEQSVTATPVINETITPVNTALVMSQFNPATGTLLGANVAYATDAHISIQSTITNPANQPNVTGNYSGDVTTTITVPGQASFPGVALTSNVSQPNVNFTVFPGPGTLTDGSDGKLVVSVNLIDPKSGSFFMTPAQASGAGYVGTGDVAGAAATGTGVAVFAETGGGNETASTVKFAHTTATLNADYFYIVPGAISGLKFVDVNGNGNQDAGDVGLAGWVINLTGTTSEVLAPDGITVLDPGNVAVSTSTTTIAGGTYTFSGLAPGDYVVDEAATNPNFPGFHHTFGGPYTVHIGADGTATVGSSTGNNFGNAPTPAAKIEITPNAVNEVNANHTFTATVQADDGLPANLFGGDAVTGFAPVAGAPVTITLTNSNNAVATPAGPFNGNSNASGQFTATFTSATAGQVTGHASAVVTVSGQTLTVSTNGVAPNSGDAVKTFVNANITINPPTAINAVGSPHTLTVTVQQNAGTGAGWVNVPDGTSVTLNLVNSNGASAVFTANSGTTLNVTTTGGIATAVINSTTGGTVTINASTTLSVNGVTLTRATGDGKGEVGHVDGPAAQKIYIAAGARIHITPNATNEVNASHTFTAFVEADDGAPAGTPGFDNVTGFAPAVGANTTITLTNSNGAVATPPGPFNGSTNASGNFSATFTSATSGKVTGHASAIVLVNGQQLTVNTDGQNGNGTDAVKTFVDADIQITPPTAENPVGTDHVLTVTVEQNDGNSWFAAPAGTLVDITLLNNTANATIVAGGVPLGGTTTTVTLGAGGTATFTINGPQAGDVTIHASVTLSVGGVSLTRATGDGKGETGHIDGSDAIKSYVGNPGASATMGFWHNKNGQAVIKSAPTIGNDLAAAYPNLFGTGAAAFNLSGSVKFMNLTGQSASNVAAYFLKLFNVTGPHTYAQVMSNVLAAYFDSVNNTSTAQKFGFGGDLLANAITITSSQAALLGLPTNTTVGAYLTRVNDLMAGQNGIVPSSLFKVFNDVSSQINEAFDI